MVDVVTFINPASTGGNGTTSALSGVNAAFVSMSAWDAASQADLVGAGTNIHRVKCAGGVDSVRAIIEGWTLDITHRIIIEGDRDQSDGFNDGVAFSTAFYHKVLLSGQSGEEQISCRDDFITIDGIQHLNSGSSAAERACVNFDTGPVAGNVFVIKNCKFKSDSSDNQMHGIWSDNLNVNLTIEACTFEWTSVANCKAINCRQLNTVDIFGCAIQGAAFGVHISTLVVTGDTIVMRNNNIFDCTDDINDTSVGATITIDNNGSDDLDGTNTTDLSPGGTEADDHALAFNDFANGDFTLIAGSPCIAAGTATDHLVNDQLAVAYVADDLGPFAFVPLGGVVVSPVAMGVRVGMGL